MALNFRKFLDGIRVIPKTASTVLEKGDLDVTDSSGKLNYHNGSSSSPIVTEAHSATLTNKTIDSASLIGPTTLVVNSASDALRITQTGAGAALRVEDSANPDSTPFIVDTSGNVGIGTAAPNAKLQVIGDALFGLDSNRVRANSSAAVGILEFNSTAGIIRSNLAGSVLAFETAGANERMRIDASGNVGIGTSAAAGRLHLSSDASTVQYIDTYTATPDPAIVFRTARGTSLAPTATQSGDSIGFIGARGYGATGFGIGSRAYMAFLAAENWTDSAQGTQIVFRTTANAGTTTTERLRITSSGLVGINTTSPSATAGGIDIASGGLSLVIGAENNSNARTNATAKLGRIGGYHYTNTEEPISVVLAESTLTASNITIGGGSGLMNAATGVQFYTAANTTTLTGTERMRIDSSGNVGIGTTGPQAKLDIRGADSTSFFKAFETTSANGTRFDIFVNDTDGSRFHSTNTAGGSKPFIFTQGAYNTPAERMRIDSSGNVGIGTTLTATGPRFVIAGGTLPSANNTTDGNAYAFQFATNVTGRYATGNTVAFMGTYANASSIEIGAGQTGSGISMHGQAEATNPNTVRFYTNSIERLRITSTGIVGINTASPSATNGGVDIASGGQSLVVGADSSASTRTNSTLKISRIGSYHYTNAEEPMAITFAESGSTDNLLHIAGGTGGMNSATQIRFYTAANTTTLTGTERMRIDSSGRVGIATAGAANTTLDLNGTLAIRFSNNVQVGANVTITAPTTSYVRLTGGTLTSVGGIAGGVNGQKLTLINRTLSTISINNEDTVATAADRIVVGTGASFNLPNNGSIEVIYDSTTSRWVVIGASSTSTLVTSVSADTVLTSLNDVVLVNASGGARTITLPSPVSGKRISVKKTDSSANAVIISRSSAETIDGNSSVSLASQYDSYTIISDGTNWFII
jgi:hypothetical protein